VDSERPATIQEGPEAARSASAPILRLLLAFALSVPLLARAMLSGPPGSPVPSGWAVASWIVCALLAGWNAVEYGLGRAAHGSATPPWLRWSLAVPYFAVSWVGVRTVAAMVAGLAYLAAAGS